ncbi:FkbM family methyltransferase [soil metagenome]
MGLLNNFLGKKNSQSLFERLYRLSLRGMNYGRASDYQHNGEAAMLERISGMIKSDAPVLFDVGANKGEFTKHILESWKGRQIRLYVFEPSQKTYAMLKAAIPASDSVRLVNKGLGDKEGKVELYYDREGSGLASVYPRDLSYHNINFSDHETIELTTLDRFCEQNKIEAIDFLKLDVEGHELSVLRGGKKMFDEGRIKMVQFEFGGCNIDSRSFFRDYFNFFKADYDLYRILSDGLRPITSYSEKLEVFLSANYLAIRKSVD